MTPRAVLRMSTCLLFFVASLARAQPSTEPTIVNGDMLLYRDNFVLPPPDVRDSARTRAAFAFDVYQANPWPAGAMPVVFEGVEAARQATFFERCGAWTAFTGVRCVHRGDESRYVLVTSRLGFGCFASVGAPTADNGIINLGSEGCWLPNVAIHEIGHALGLMHEHQRPNRDEYVEVRLENVADDQAFAFAILASNQARTEYDFDSVMHYRGNAFSRNGEPTIVARAQYAERARDMGRGEAPSDLDRLAMASIYNITPPARSRGVGQAAFGRLDFLTAMEDLDRVYVGELRRVNGLSIGGGPDFLGIAAWIFDVYLSSRASGYTQGEAFYNVRASISQTDEWKAKNPGRASMPGLPTSPPIRLDRGEYLDAMYRLNDAYKTELLRTDGLRIGEKPDFLGIAAWIFDVYLNARLAGRTPDQAWDGVLTAIRNSDEYRQKH